MEISDVDLLVVGSGPIGAAFARQARESNPRARVLIVDAGPQLSPEAGRHVRNLPASGRLQVALQSQAGASAGAAARPGTHLVDPDGALPAAALSTCVGGMGVHWTCAAPRPGGAERIAFIEEAEWQAALSRAEALLHVSADVLAPTAQSHAMQAALAAAFASELDGARPVQPMPLACRRTADGGVHWSAPEDILAPVLDGERLTLRAGTLCRQLLIEGERVTGAVLEDRASGLQWQVKARAVAVASDALRTPQLLWASGVRPPALGRYLNDQPQLFSLITLHPQLAGLPAAEKLGLIDPLLGVLWVPYGDGGHPFHGQVMHLDWSPLRPDDGPRGGRTAALAWFCVKDIRYEDRVAFSAGALDAFGMPKMRFAYGLSARDEATVARGQALLERAVQALGTPEPGGAPRLLPHGSSLHYQGSVRMGAADDGHSVCDTHSRVWGLRNLFVGGLGVIPSATACNTTLMAMALAVRASERIADLLPA